jgi:hypothetical protein
MQVAFRAELSGDNHDHHNCPARRLLALTLVELAAKRYTSRLRRKVQARYHHSLSVFAQRLLRACLSRVFLYCVNRLAGTFPAQEHDLLVFKRIGGFEKLFEFVDRSRRQMSDVLQVSFKGSPIRKRKDPVITFTFPLAGLQDA